ncbi:hypothetical protein ACSHUI_00240 [Bacillus subtilis]|uniref:hypothetical protein n=1 Tax=Bacillus subtilis TaxID=1423 RepID=UPI003CF7F260
MYNLKIGDRVEHVHRGKGTLLDFCIFGKDVIVEFDENSSAKGKTLVVDLDLLKKIDD